MTEDDLEQLCLSWFTEGGWRVSYGPDLAPDGSSPERSNYQSVLLLVDVEQAIRSINPHLPYSVCAKFAHTAAYQWQPSLQRLNVCKGHK